LDLIKLNVVIVNRLSPNSKVCIVVPCFNEEQRLASAEFIRFAHSFQHIHFIFVDDGSSDGTFATLKQIERQVPQQVYVERLPHNSGKGEAVRAGMSRGIELGFDMVGYWDADLATPLQEINEFQRVLDRDRTVQGVLGCRLPLMGRKIERHPLRALLGRCFALAASTVLRARIWDTQCGAKLFRSTGALAAVLRQPFGSRWIFDVELLARLSVAHEFEGKPGGCLYELPLAQWSEIAGSKIRIHHFFRAAADLLDIFWQYSGSRRQGYRSWLRQSMSEESQLLKFAAAEMSAAAETKSDKKVA